MPEQDPTTLANALRTLEGRGLTEVARAVIRAERGGQVEITDGPWDRGQDLRLSRAGREVQVRVQCKAGRNWERELRAFVTGSPDGCEIWWFTTERVSETARQKLRSELLEARGVTVEWYDNRRIAAVAVERGIEEVVLREARLPGLSPGANSDTVSLAERTAYAIAAWSEDAQELRRSVDDAVLLDVLHDSGGTASVTDLVSRCRLRLRLDPAVEPRLRGAVERLRQAGRILGPNGTVELSPDERRRIALVRATQLAEMERARTELGEVLEGLRVSDTHVVDLLVARLGALLLAAAGSVADQGPTDPLADALRQLRLDLAAAGVGPVDEVLLATTRAAQALPLAGHLVAGEVWRLTSHIRPTALMAMLGSVGVREQPVVYLDANVAMPMLLGLEFRVPPLRFFLAADHLHRQVRRLGLRTVVPTPWLEEMASQLVAALDFEPVIEVDPDLAASHNIYVALYAARGLPRAGFREYLKGLGLPRGTAGADFRGVRDRAMGSLRQLLAERGVHVEDPPRARWPKIEERWAYVCREAGREPASDITARHDIEVIGWLEQHARGPALVCTWHRLLHAMDEGGAMGWDAVSPEALANLLALGAEPASFEPTVLETACLALSEDDHRRGARVWEALVRRERGNLEDASLRAEARRFKEDWLERQFGAQREDDIVAQWEAWKVRVPRA